MTLPQPLKKIVDKFIELHGDRVHGETNQVCCGLGWIGEQKFVIIIVHDPGGTRGGNKLSTGYRKSLRMLKLAEQLGKPVLWWGENSEISVADLSLDLLNNINENIKAMLDLKVPIIGVFPNSRSGGALCPPQYAISPDIVDHAVFLTDDDELPLSSFSELVERAALVVNSL